jgi:hypothetical protein
MNNFLGPTFFSRSRVALSEAVELLSATRLTRMAAAILKMFQFELVVAQHQLEFSGPGLRTS